MIMTKVCIAEAQPVPVGSLGLCLHLQKVDQIKISMPFTLIVCYGLYGWSKNKSENGKISLQGVATQQSSTLSTGPISKQHYGHHAYHQHINRLTKLGRCDRKLLNC